MLLEELDEILAWDSPILRTRNAVSLETAGVEPFTHGSRGHLTDLCDLSCGEHLHMQDLRFPYVFQSLRNPTPMELSKPLSPLPAQLPANSKRGCQSVDNTSNKHLGQGFQLNGFPVLRAQLSLGRNLFGGQLPSIPRSTRDLRFAPPSNCEVVDPNDATVPS